MGYGKGGTIAPPGGSADELQAARGAAVPLHVSMLETLDCGTVGRTSGSTGRGHDHSDPRAPSASVTIVPGWSGDSTGGEEGMVVVARR